MSEQDQREFRARFHDVFVEALSHIASLPPSTYVSRHYGWPELSYGKSGMPSIRTSSSFDGPVDYSDVFTPVKGLRDAPELPSLEALLDAVKRSRLLRNRLLPRQLAEATGLSVDEEKIVDSLISHLVYSAVDRYVHIHNSRAFEEENFERVFRPLERGIFDDPLPLDVAVPILFLQFDFEEARLSDNACIRRMDDAFQRARASQKAYGPGVHESVMAAATHALVLEGWSMPNQGWWPASNITTEVAAYPRDQIDLFFAALRVETGVKTGYAQLLIVPQDWMLHWMAGLPPLDGTSIRAYPLAFEHYYWLVEQLTLIDEAAAQRVAQLWRALTEATENSLKVAVRRLNLCFLRDNQEDAAIDATIGLEAALSDDEPQEMTHKLALRIAALSRYFGDCQKSAHQVFREIKSVYRYRSALVHGSSSSDTKREIRVSETVRVEASELAVEYLRAVVRVLAANAELRKPTYIDRHLLLGEPTGNPNERMQPTAKGGG